MSFKEHPGKESPHKRRRYIIAAVLGLTALAGGLLIHQFSKEKGATLMELTTALPVAQDFYKNPIPINKIGDPFVFLGEDGLYYMIATSAPNGYFCWVSENSTDWTFKSKAFEVTSEDWCCQDFWAPEVVFKDGLYHMFYTAKEREGVLKIGLATSETPYGPYKDVLGKPLVDVGYAVIDANVLADDDGKYYIYFSRDCSQNRENGMPQSHIYGALLSDDLRSLASEPTLLLKPDQSWETGSTETQWNEGPEAIKHNGTYYLTYSANFFADRYYSVGCATSDSPLGPFTKYDSNPILTVGNYQEISGSGHHSFFKSPDGKELFMAYHTHTDPKNPSGDRQMNIDKVIFQPDGTMSVNGPTASWMPSPSGNGLSRVGIAVSHKGEPLPSLSDEIIAIHKRDASETISSGGEPITLKISLEKTQPIRGIAIYKSGDTDLDFGEIKVTIDGKYTLNIPASAERIERSVIGMFQPTEASEIEIEIQPLKEGKIGISEVEVYC